MHVNKLACQNFRNYERLEIEFGKHTNILYGENAQGKTNILEAVYLGLTSRSHRGAKDKDIIEFGKEDSHIRIELTKKEFNHRIDMQLRKNSSKGVAIDKVVIRKLSELFTFSNVIFFSPEDLSIVKNGPSERRKFMNIENSKISAIYYSDLINYRRILDQRNNLLKEIMYKKELEDTLEIWDRQLIDSGSKIIHERNKFLTFMNEIIKDIHSDLTGGREEISLVYEPDVNEDEFENKLKIKKNQELKYATTEVGPQRDDFGIFINGKDVRIYGSQGQQRTAALSIKLSEIELVKKITGDMPVSGK